METGRIKPKAVKTFGIKKPYAGKDKNRKGNKKVTVRLKPVYSAKKGTKRERVNNNTFNLLGKDRPIVFSTSQYWQRVVWVQELENCQVCGLLKTLDHPHHPHTGANRDDRYIINVCLDCHNLIHMVGYDAVAKSLDECIAIGWENNLMCELKELDSN